MRERQPERMLRVIAETTERVDVFRTRRVRTCLSLSVNKIHPSLHEPTLSASFLPYELCYSTDLHRKHVCVFVHKSLRRVEIAPRVGSDDLEPLALRESGDGSVRQEREHALPVVLHSSLTSR